MRRKSVWNRLGTGAGRAQPESSVVGPIWEPLEPRLLLSVGGVFECVQPVDPATPEEAALYISAHTETAQPTPEQTRIFIVTEGTQTTARVLLEFRDSGYYASSWGDVQQEGNTFFVNAQLQRFTGGETGGAMTLAHEYNLGTLAEGTHVFEFRAWDQPLESREFRPGSEQFVEYVPTPEQTKLFVTQDGANSRADVSMLFPSSGYAVRNWGEVRRDRDTFYVDAELERWTGASLTVMTTLAHEYDLGTLAEGDYVFEFRVSGHPIESREFRPGSEQFVEYVPTADQTTVVLTSDGARLKAKVTMLFPTGGYVVRSWGQVKQHVDIHFDVNVEVERWTGPVTTAFETVTHEYDLGPVGDSDYYDFAFRAWNHSVEFTELRLDGEQVVPYVPRAEMTNLFFMADGAGGTKARVAIDLPDPGHYVSDWGTVQRVGNTFFVNAEVQQRTVATPVIESVSHDYDLGVLPEGNYVFTFNAWGEPVESQGFATGDLLQPVYRFWSPAYARHFYTLDEAERGKVLNDYADIWIPEGVAYYAFANDAEADTSPVYRFWSDSLRSHFYTLSQSERDKLINDPVHLWTYEGIAFYAYAGDRSPVGTNPVYRFWSGELGSHFFTASDAEMNKLMSLAPRMWAFEGFAWYACRA